MKLINLFTSAILVVYIISLLIKKPRLGILTGLTFTSFTLFGLPWQLFPVWGVQSIVKNAFVALSLILYLKKPRIGNYKFVFIIFFRELQ
ncbi:MAG: hypothetical protein AVO33_01280 [delta proteobacterium ML8_F1]|nr:MAG: hypothetical protein AVO33_01280 [delta proteobacterium ML8_F1]